MNIDAHASAGRKPAGFLKSPLMRFLGFVRPHFWLVAGGSVMGIAKFTLPLIFPLTLKYVFDVLLVPQPHVERINALIDRWCVAIAGWVGVAPTAAGKLAALTAALTVIFVIQAIAT